MIARILIRYTGLFAVSKFNFTHQACSSFIGLTPLFTGPAAPFIGFSLLDTYSDLA